MNSVTKHIAWVVDDDPLVRETLAIALEESFVVQQACSGEEILQRLVTQPGDAQPEPGLVLLDY